VRVCMQRAPPRCIACLTKRRGSAVPFQAVVAGNKSRKNPRAAVSLVARYRSPTAFEFLEEECVDLSSGGMFIKSKAPAPAGTLLKLECDIDHGEGTMRAVARVVWLRERETHDEPQGMGVKFVKLEPGGRELIAQLLERIGGSEGAGPAARSSRPPAPSAPRASSSTSLAPLVAQAKAATGPAVPAALIEAKPPKSPSSAPPAKPESARKGQQPAAKQQEPQAPRVSTKPKSDKSSRRSSAAPRSDVPTHRPPPPRSGLDMKAIGLGALLLIGVALIATFARQAPRDSVSGELVAEPTEGAGDQANYVLHLSTFPSGARIEVGDHAGVSPLTIELGPLNEGLQLRAEKEGFEPVTSNLELARFNKEGGQRVAAVTLALPVLPREQ